MGLHAAPRWMRILSLVGLFAAVPLAAAATWGLSRALGQRTDVSNRRTCMANLEQLGRALIAYASDNDALGPPPSSWCDALLPAVGSEDVFRCPSDSRGSTASYAFNGALAQLPLSDLANAPSVPAIYDSSQRQWNAVDRHPQPCDPPRHAGVNIAAMCDGSARAIAGQQTLAWPRLLGGAESQPSLGSAVPRYSGASLLFRSARLGFTTEYPANWTAAERGGAVRFAPKEAADTWVEIARAQGPASRPSPSGGTRTRVTLAPTPGAFPVECEVLEYEEQGTHWAVIELPTEPPLRAQLRAPTARWEDVHPGLLLPVTALRLAPAPGTPTSRAATTGP